MRCPVGGIGRRRPRVAGGNRRLQHVPAVDARQAFGPGAAPHRRARLQQRSQRPRFWSGSRTGCPSGPTRAARRDAWISINATRPCTSASPGISVAEHATEPQRLVAQRRPHPVVAGGRRVALVEHQLDRPRAPRRAARRARRRAGPRTAPALLASVRLARTIRCATVGSGTRNARAISVGGQPAEQPQGQRDPRLGRQHGMARDEHQPQHVVADVVVQLPPRLTGASPVEARASSRPSASGCAPAGCAGVAGRCRAVSPRSSATPRGCVGCRRPATARGRPPVRRAPDPRPARGHGRGG